MKIERDILERNDAAEHLADVLKREDWWSGLRSCSGD